MGGRKAADAADMVLEREVEFALVKYELKVWVGGLVDSRLGIQRCMSCTRSASFCFCLSRSFCIVISSELDPLEEERVILRGEGVETDTRRDLSSGLTGEAGTVEPARTAGVTDR